MAIGRYRFERKYLAFAVLLLGMMIAFFVFLTAKFKRERDDQVAVHRAVEAIRGAQGSLFYNFDKTILEVNRPGEYWTGDVSGLHGLGLLDREIAEADAAPINRLTPQPRPYHGYYFVALESGDGRSGPVPLKGLMRSKDSYGICAYPAEGNDVAKYVYLMCPGRTWRSFVARQRPTQWPSDSDMQNQYAIVD